MKTFLHLCSICLITLAVSSCDTFYRAFLVNNTNEEVTVIANQELNIGNPNIISFVREENGLYVHKFVPNSEYVLAAGIDMPVTEGSIPCDTLIIISSDDTLQYNSKAEMFAAMTIVTDQRMELRIN